MKRQSITNGVALALILATALGAQTAAQSCCSKQGADTSATAASCCTKDAAQADTHAGRRAETTTPDAAVGHGEHAAQGGVGQGRMGPGAGGHGGGMGMRTVMPDAMRLLHNYTSLKRTTEEIPNGVRTVTTTSDPAVLELLRRHPREMYTFYESGGAVRPHDPMFRELSRVADKVTMEFKDIENGIEVIAMSDDPEVVKLLRAHAQKVSAFVDRGMPALHEGAPLPEDYEPAS